MSSPLVDQPSSPRTHASVPQSLDATADSQSIVKPSWTYSQNAAARSSSSSTMASPTLSPDWYPGSSTLGSGYFPLLRRPSATSGRSLSSIEMAQAAMARSSSTMSIPMKEGDVEVVTEEGLGHVGSRLVARRYKTHHFAQDLLDVLLTLRIPTWSSFEPGFLLSTGIKITKVVGSLTNAVFFVSYPTVPSVKTLLLRIYGSYSSQLISRTHELHTLHILSSQYNIGPHIYGTFENGRVEEWFDSVALTPADMRDVQESRWIGARMAELHCVDVEAVEKTTPTTRGENVGWEIAARKNVRAWVHPAREVLQLSGVKEEVKEELELDRFIKEWETYIAWVAEWERQHGASKRVFAHNDAQYGNLLKLTNVPAGTPEHRQIIVVDFEYAAPNPAAFDIANHFHEWTSDYNGRTPHLLDPTLYPTEPERNNFYHAYLTHACPPFTTVPAMDGAETESAACARNAMAVGGEMPMDIETEMHALDAQVRVWSPATHAMWAVWGIVQAREDIEAEMDGTAADPLEFDYMKYAKVRMASFRREMKGIGL